MLFEVDALAKGESDRLIPLPDYLKPTAVPVHGTPQTFPVLPYSGPVRQPLATPHALELA